MGKYEFDEQEVREIFEKIKFLTPRQQRLLEALIAVALNSVDDPNANAAAAPQAATATDGDREGLVEVKWPDDQPRRKFYSYFERRLAGGKVPSDKGPEGSKIGGRLTFSIDPD